MAQSARVKRKRLARKEERDSHKQSAARLEPDESDDVDGNRRVLRARKPKLLHTERVGENEHDSVEAQYRSNLKRLDPALSEAVTLQLGPNTDTTNNQISRIVKGLKSPPTQYTFVPEPAGLVNITPQTRTISRTLPTSSSVPLPQAFAEEAQHILHLPVYRQRRFKATLTKEHGYRWAVPKKVKRPAYLLETGSATRVEVWRLTVQNRAGPILPVLQQDPRRSSGSYNGKQEEMVDPGIFLLETTRFPSRSDVETLGNVVCAMLNRFPGDIDATAWNKPDDEDWRNVSTYWLREWIEGIAFLIVFPNFDFTTLADSRWNSTGYFPNSRLLLEFPNKVAATKHRSAATYFQFRFSDIAWVTNVVTSKTRGAGRTVDQLLRINVASAPDMASLHPILAQVTTNQLYRPTVPSPGTFTADQIEVVCRVATIVRQAICGFVGKRELIINRMNRIMWWLNGLLLQKADLYMMRPSTLCVTAYEQGAGPCDGMQLFYVSYPRSCGVTIFLSRKLSARLKITGSSSSDPTITIAKVNTFQRVVAAWFHEQGLQDFIRNHCILRAILVCAQAVDRFHLGAISTREMRATYCRCTSAERVHMVHVCMNCNEAHRCISMSWVDEFFICKHCADRARPPQNQILITPKRRVTCLVQYAITGDQKGGFPVTSTSKKSLMLRLLKNVSADKGTFNSAYSSPSYALQSEYEDRKAIMQFGIAGGRQAPHPLSASVDALHLFYMLDGKVFHHTPVNTVLCTWIENVCKWENPVSFMSWIGEMIRVSFLIVDKPVTVEYPEWAHEFYTALHAAADHAHVINSLVPKRSKWRVDNLFRYTQVEFDAILLPMFVEGVVDWSYNLASYFDRASTGPKCGWTQADIKRISAFIKSLFASTEWNPHRLEPIIHPSGIFIWFNPSEMTPDMSWAWLYAEMYEIFRRFDEECDPDHEHDCESPETVLYWIVLQWLQTGGKCPTFRVRFSIYTSHPLRYSVGRAIMKTDHWGHQMVVRPSEKMGTGFLVPNPTDMQLHYDKGRCTMVCETWLSNSARLNFPIAPKGPDGLDGVRDLLKHIKNGASSPDGQKIYAATKQSYPPIQKPNTRNVRALRGRHRDEMARFLQRHGSDVTDLEAVCSELIEVDADEVEREEACCEMDDGEFELGEDSDDSDNE